MSAVPAFDWAAGSPVLVTVCALVLVLLVDAVLPRAARARRLLDVIAVAGLLAAGAALLALARGGATRATLCVAGPLDSPLCSFVVSDLTRTLQGIVLLAALGSLLMTLDGPGARDRTGHHSLVLAATSGALVLMAARDLASILVALETVTLPAVLLVALRRDAQGAQAALSLLLTAIGSLAVLVLGTGLLLLTTGSLYLEQIAVVLAAPDLSAGVQLLAGVGAALLVAGLGFKVSLVPFHLWTPDTYAGAPLPVAAFLSTVSKVAGVSALALLLGLGLPGLAHLWAPMIGVLALLTITVGNLVALRQWVAVRVLAWSTVAQAGWVLLPLATVDGSGESVRQAFGAMAGYLLAYVLASLAAFAVVVLVARHHPDGEEHTLDAYRGLVRTEPVAGGALAFALANLAGIPPGIMGLLAKVVVLQPLVLAQAWWLAVPAAFNVALALAYYLRWAGFLVAARDPQGAALRWRVRPAEGLVLGGATAAALGLSVAGQLVAGLVTGSVL